MQLLLNTCVASSINTKLSERFLLHIQDTSNVEVLHDEVMYILHFIFPGSSSLRLLTSPREKGRIVVSMRGHQSHLGTSRGKFIPT